MVITGEPTIFDEPSDPDSDLEMGGSSAKPDVQQTAPDSSNSRQLSAGQNAPTVRSRQSGAGNTGSQRNESSSSQILVPNKEWSDHSIYKVPNFIKSLNEKAYKPQMVSLGPYHHDDPDLSAMREHKQRALSYFLGRMGKTHDDCREDMRFITKDAASCYADLEERWLRREEEFLDMLILDGCFILEVVHVFHGLSSDYREEDPIFSPHGQLYNFPVIRRDMLLIENQVPFLVLEKLMEFKRKPPPRARQARARDTARGFGVSAKDRENISKLILQFCTLRESNIEIKDRLHVVDIYRKGLLRNPSRPTTQPKPGTTTTSTDAAEAPPPPPRPTSTFVIRCALELHEAGVEFRPSSFFLDDLSFNGGVLSLPVLVVDDSTESTFLNLIAFERLHVGAGNDVTSYVFFMDNLIESAKDVSLLSDEKIVRSIVGSDEEVAAIFNKLSDELTINPDNSLVDVREKIRKHCDTKWNRWRANLLHEYFTSPWTIISLIIAIVYLILSLLQTNYAIMDFYKPDDDNKKP